MVWSAVRRLFLLTMLSNRCYSFFFLISKCMPLCVCNMCVRVRVSIYLYMCIYIHVCIYIYVYVSVCAYIMLRKYCADESSLDFFSRLHFFVPFLCA